MHNQEKCLLRLEQLDFIIIMKEEMDYSCTRKNQGNCRTGEGREELFKTMYAYPNKTRGILDREKRNSTSENIRTVYLLSAWIGGEFGGEWIHVYVWLTPFTVHLKLPQHC